MLGYFLALLLLGAGGGKVESVGAFSGAGASDSVRSALEPKGHRVVLDGGVVLCEVWWRGGVPTRAKADVPGAIHTEFEESTLVGVISFPKDGQNYRGLPIKPGAYTLRYWLMPNDGNHMGAAPYRDFLLLIPVADDQNVGAQYKFEEIVKLSAAGAPHPAPLSLVSPEGQKEFPAVVEKEGHVVLMVKLKTASGTDLTFALVVKGVAEQ